MIEPVTQPLPYSNVFSCRSKGGLFPESTIIADVHVTVAGRSAIAATTTTTAAAARQDINVISDRWTELSWISSPARFPLMYSCVGSRSITYILCMGNGRDRERDVFASVFVV